MKDAVIYTGNARLVGRLLPSAKPGEVVMVHEAFELVTGVVVVPGEKGLQIGPTTVPVLVDGSDRFVDIEAFATAIRWFDGMGKVEVAFLEEARRQKKEESEQRRAKNAGLVLPGNGT